MSTFWVGVLAAISSEAIAFVAVIIYALIKSTRKNNSRRNNQCQDSRD